MSQSACIYCPYSTCFMQLTAYIPNFLPISETQKQRAPRQRACFLAVRGQKRAPLTVPQGKRGDRWAQHKPTGKLVISFAGRTCSYRTSKTIYVCHRLQLRQSFFPITLNALTNISVQSIDKCISKD